ncbi:DUF6479 family protein [Streptomyces naganishii]|uniref:Secreted protein n=1 Tax=Streptomyces naganishii JCM 4654 TaxID=1306179 RepID=A0A919CVT3_9ACTN|nr:DUF6479 family protein [Streptomyces naganishii]GHD89148.1 hypothetical protein GCM10010508_28190 [Streptomyces naganishii JCM 4654]
MVIASYAVLAASSHQWAVLGAFIIGFCVVVGGLVWAVWMGIRVMLRESERPKDTEQPRLPVTGAVHEISEMREPDEVHCEDGERLMPYELHAAGSRRSEDQHRHRWAPGSSGSFGSGGPGRT